MAKTYNVVATQFNNYFNRILKKYESLAAYIEGRPNFVQQEVNFNPNDGIETTFVLGKGNTNETLLGLHNFNYFIYYSHDSAAENPIEIISRWFILDSVRIRGGQVRLRLKRDVLADSFNDIIKAPLYVERGIINDLDSPLLLNNEDLKVNQIKKKEILLTDETKCAWLVLYLKKGVLGNQGIGPDSDGTIPVNVPKEEAFVYEELTTPIASWNFYQYQTTDFLVNDSAILEVYFNDTTNKVKYIINENGKSSIVSSYVWTFNQFYPSNLKLKYVAQESQEKSRLDAQYLPNYISLHGAANSAFGYSKVNDLLKYNGKIIKDSTGKYFEITAIKLNGGSKTHKITSADAPLLKANMNSYFNLAFEQDIVANDDAFKFKVEWSGWRIEINERKDLEVRFNFGEYTGKGTQDSPLFDAVCLPYGDLEMYIGTEVSTNTYATKDKSLKIMNALATILTSQYVLDLQLLPYCPCQNLVNSTYFEEDGIFVPEDEAGNIIKGYFNANITDFMLVCNSVNFTLDIEQTVNISDSTDVPEVYKIKYVNDCTLIRLCSPNYNGLFDMNLAKNGMNINSFNVDVTLRPFNPYIHINPNFSFLYGEDFNDARGLICGGDFSLGIINDAWNVYEIQNKNYQAIFDRQIQNLDINNAIAMQEAGWGAAAGVISGAASGAAGGAIVGGGWGALAGAVIGAGSSAIGGALDIANLQKRQQETRNYAIDNFNLQLGNVRALPYSITKTSPITFNNKLFPFVEIYECSEIEKTAYYEKIKYNGMSVRIIDRMANYWSGNNSQYFRAHLIRIEDFAEDTHYIETINEELMKGVFI